MPRSCADPVNCKLQPQEGEISKVLCTRKSRNEDPLPTRSHWQGTRSWYQVMVKKRHFWVQHCVTINKLGAPQTQNTRNSGLTGAVAPTSCSSGCKPTGSPPPNGGWGWRQGVDVFASQARNNKIQLCCTHQWLSHVLPLMGKKC